MLRYKFDVIEALKNKGYSTYRIRKEKLFGESTVQDFRNGRVVMSNDCVDKLCRILQVQVGDLIEYVDE